MKILKVLVLIFGLTVFANAQKANLSGKVYDPNGALVVSSKLTAVNNKGERFEALTNGEGEYTLSLTYNQYQPTIKYNIIVEANGFEKFTLKDFRFVGKLNNSMLLDFALDVENSEPCGYGGADCIQDLTPVKTIRSKISKKIKSKPLKEVRINKENNKQ